MEIKSKIEQIRALQRPMQVSPAPDPYRITGFIPDHLNPTIPCQKTQGYNEAIYDVLKILETE